MTAETPTLTGPIVEPADGQPPRRLVVLIHGYGADGQDLIGLAPHLQRILPDALFVAPNGPDRCGVNPMGYQWFPIPWMDGSSEQAMAQGFVRAAAALDAFLDAQMAEHGLTEAQTALIGFSQGTMMSLHIGPRRARQLAGIVGFSGRLVDGEGLKQAAVTHPPVLLVHGDMDEMIPVKAMEDARDGLAAAGIPVRWHVSRGIGHGIGPDGFEQAARFLAGLDW
ncbi:alpha/beta hydrolase [Futiania mangrovi]|uniref:Prolyl oligopeptidase family serine peptidase n=1 Tax=Futiania mangrovi TaxID=2959716 RepID=A0A9J6PD90_9PROT|nr:dienelactone hydrolase family protein [Futiania mangrovii]MCP1336302.1 prolyl oligopeptidase family serine peptidase [Futiania mangrovii]